MPGYRGRIAEAVNSFGFTAPARWIHNRGRSPLLCLAYHRVMPLPDPATYPFDLELISATPEDFDAQMAYLRRHFNPVPLSAVVDHLVNGTQLPDRPVIVTFDDGFDDNLRYAGPVLRRHHIVATIFLATDLVGSRLPYWFELAVYLMMRLPVGALHVPDIPTPLPDADDWMSRRRCGGLIQRRMMQMTPPELAAITTQWRTEFAHAIRPEEFSLSGLLTWENVRGMDGQGFEFGSHSKTHPTLSVLDEAALREELQGSRARLERELGHPVTTIAYPIGKEFAYSPLVQQVASETGYRLGAAYVAGVNWIGSEFRNFALRRQNIERHHDMRRFEAMVQFPDWIKW